MPHKSNQTTKSGKLRDAIRHSASAIAVVVLLIAGFWGSHYLTPSASDVRPEDEPSTVANQEPLPVVKLTPQKLESAAIHVSKATNQTLQALRTVAGTINYDATQHVVLKAPVDCTVKTVLVKPGHEVKQGETLGLLSGTEVALARSQIRKCEADLKIARIKHDWAKETHDNLLELLAALREFRSLNDIETQFEGKTLGEHRDHLLTAYARYQLTTSVADQTKPLGEKGIVSGRTFEARASERDVAATEFKTACEQSNYESRRELATAEAELDAAQQQLQVQQETLRLLLGPFTESTDRDSRGDFELRAPFDGRIEAVHAASASRVEAGEPLLVLANTNDLWVSAWIHQHDWEVLKTPMPHTVRVSVPSMPETEYTAEISFVGPEISPATRAVSLVADLDNREGRFRPGMFAWVSLPIGPPREGLAISPSALLRHEERTYVFVQESPLTFRRNDVRIGLETPQYVEILQGLTAEQEVVDQGAFYLQAEMLLEQESE